MGLVISGLDFQYTPNQFFGEVFVSGVGLSVYSKPVFQCGIESSYSSTLSQYMVHIHRGTCPLDNRMGGLSVNSRFGHVFVYVAVIMSDVRDILQWVTMRLGGFYDRGINRTFWPFCFF